MWITPCATACLLSACALGCDFARAGPRMELLTPEHRDYGLVDCGLLRVVWGFSNTGTEPLEITAIERTCACLRVDWPRHPLEQGESGRIVAHVRLAPGQSLREAVIVSTNEPGAAKRTLIVEAYGRTAVHAVFRQKEVDLGATQPGAVVRRAVALDVTRISSAELPQVSILSVSGSGLRAHILRGESEERRTGPFVQQTVWVLLEYTPGDEERRLEGAVSCRASVEGSHSLARVRVTATDSGLYEVRPRRCYLPMIVAGSETLCSFRVRRNDGRPFELTSEKGGAGDMHALRSRCDPNSTIHRIECAVRVPSPGVFSCSTVFVARLPGEDTFQHVVLRAAGVAR